ncbi:MAG: DUF4296 domain-containing protein [Crocinitomicaceae bacterium]|nr:DUF4296 domain-containing protein [Crocinitomicaceae bacterium]
MIKKIHILAVGLLILSSCGQKEESLPEGIIPKEEFTEILVQVQLMESYCQDTYVRPDIYKELLQNSVDSLLKAHGKTTEEYVASFDYYTTQPEVMFEVYEKVLEKINNMQVTTNAVKKEEGTELK